MDAKSTIIIIIIRHHGEQRSPMETGMAHHDDECVDVIWLEREEKRIWRGNVGLLLKHLVLFKTVLG